MEVTPRMLKVAWAAFRGDRTGPLIGSSGPAFREAIEAALAECEEIERLRAENERLREALEKIASGELFQHAHDYARAALGEEKKR